MTAPLTQDENETVRRIVPIALRGAGLEVEAARCEAVDSLDAAANAAADAANAAAYAANAAADAASAAAYAANAAANAAGAVWPIAIKIAEGAFAIGNQAPPSDIALISDRMEQAKRKRVVA